MEKNLRLISDTTKPKSDTLNQKTDTLSTAGEENGFESKVDYEAEDSIRIGAEDKKAFLYGNASVHYEDFDLKAAYIEIDNKVNLLTAVGLPDSSGNIKGSPEFKQGKEDMKCEKIVYNIKTKKGKIFGILTKQNDFFIHGQAVKKDTNNIMSIKKMKCIPCEFEDARIYFRASRAKVIPGDKIVTGPLFLEVSNIPTPLGLPFGFFPNVKIESSKAGILMPSYGYSQTQGFYLQNMGYFIPVSKSVQMFLFGNIYSNGSWAINTNSPHPMLNYKVNYKYSGSFNFAFSQNNTGIMEDNPKPHAIRDANALTKAYNFRVSWNHTQDNKYDPTVRFSVSIDAGSSGFGKYNNQASTTYLQSNLMSNVAFTKTFKNSMLTINSRVNQNLQTNDSEVDAPQLTYAVNRMFPFKNQAHTTQTWLDKLYVDYTLQTQATVTTKDSLLFTKATLDSIKYGLYQRIPIGTNINLFKYFTLNPQATFQQYTNFQTTEEAYNPRTKTVNTFVGRTPALAFDQSYQVNLTTKVYGDYLFNSKILKQIRHQVIPTIGFAYHPDMEGSKLNIYKQVTDSNKVTSTYSRFQNGLFGGPAGPASGALTFNINNTLDAKVRKSTDTSVSYQKVALLQMLSIGGSYDFMAKQNKLSLLNVSARTSFFKNIVGVSFVSVFDPYALNKYGNRSDTLLYKSSGKLVRFTSCNFSVNATLTNAKIKGLEKSKLPFSIGLNYNLSFVKGITGSGNPENPSSTIITPNQYTQNLGGTFSIKPTVNWKFNITTGYDFKLNSISYTSFTIHRDLRCWESNITWVPFGPAKQYMLTLNLKVPSLSTIKIPKQKLWQDNT
ncbi:MAG: putative LPS assembly protein LptD [Bacteroidia bacterium]